MEKTKKNYCYFADANAFMHFSVHHKYVFIQLFANWFEVKIRFSMHCIEYFFFFFLLHSFCLCLQYAYLMPLCECIGDTPYDTLLVASKCHSRIDGLLTLSYVCRLFFSIEPKERRKWFRLFVEWWHLLRSVISTWKRNTKHFYDSKFINAN